MSTTKWTQGPWSVVHDTDITGVENDPANGCVGPVDVAHVYLRTVPGRTEANATLIAAAPELYKALDDLLGYFRSGNAVDVERATIKASAPEVLAAQVALKKARGE